MTNYKHDIEKYLKGELTAAEMHALEKKALTDPFLADALEGSESISQDELSADLLSISEKINKRIEKKDRHISPWTWTMRIAAGLLVLAISTYFIVTMTNEKPNSNLALNEQEETPPIQKQPLPPADNSVTTEANSKDESQGAVAESQSAAEPKRHSSNDIVQPEIEQDEHLAIAEEEASVVDSKINANSGFINYDTVIIRSEPFSKSFPTVASSPEKAKRKELGSAGAPAEMQADDNISFKRNTTTTKVIKGKVTDAEDGTALPGVNVTVKNTTIGTVTDAEGNFEIPSDDPNSELVFSFIGLQNVEMPVNDQENLDVKMSADFSELSEIVVVGYAAYEPGVIREPKPVDYRLAEPKGGRKAYKAYLAQNVHYPQQALENKIEGKVTVQFVVETSGLLNEFKVLKSVGHGCDEEVIRLIKNGPQWTPSKLNDVSQRAKVKVRMRFTLPD
jgi:TonB family protein